MKKRILSRALLGFPIGISIGYFITILISLVMADGSYYPVAPKLEQICGSESYAAALQFFLSGILGSAFAGSSIIWEMDNWSILKMTSVHFLITIFVMFPIAYVTYWMKHSLIGFASYFAIFVVIYVVIWFVQYVSWNRSIDKINTKITDSNKIDNAKLKGMIPFLIIVGVMFNILPLGFRFLNPVDGTSYIGIILLLMVFPIITLVSSLILGISSGICWLYPVCIAVLFIPALFIYYNDSAFIYMIIYGVLACIGNLIGSLFQKASIRNTHSRK